MLGILGSKAEPLAHYVQPSFVSDVLYQQEEIKKSKIKEVYSWYAQKKEETMKTKESCAGCDVVIELLQELLQAKKMRLKKLRQKEDINNIKTPHRPSWLRDSWSGDSDKENISPDNEKNGIFSGNMMSKRIITEISQ
ncbi:MAG: hypothetical protein U9M94_02065 [Patescibacteria group bacterium]|nr:hypothetical protein [Patescibacteria group bacterium]